MKTKITSLLTITLLGLGSLAVRAEVATEAWVQRYNGPGNSDDRANAVAVGTNGNVYVTGYSIGSGSSNDYATVAYTGAGVPMWTNRYNGPGNSDDRANAVAVGTNGNVYVTGYSIGSGSSNDYATVAYTGAGVPMWTNRYNGPGNSYDEANALAVGTKGNVYVTGESFGSGSHLDYATVAYDSAGVPLWTNRYNGPANGGDYAYAVAAGTNGNVYVTGYSPGSGSFADYATVAYTGAGVPLWTNRYNGPGNSSDAAAAVAVGANGNVYVTGYSFSSSIVGSDDYATLAYDSAGLPLWTNRYNGAGNSGDRAAAVAVGTNGNVYVTGHSPGSGSSADYATLAYTGAGVPLWTNRYNGPANGPDSTNTKQSLAIAPDGLVVIGFSDGDFSSGIIYDYAIVKYLTVVPLTPTITTNPPVLTGVTRLGNGTFQFGFTNQTGASFTVFASTNLALPFNQWSNLGAPVESPAGTFQCTDPQATNNAMRFYRVTSP